MPLYVYVLLTPTTQSFPTAVVNLFHFPKGRRYTKTMTHKRLDLDALAARTEKKAIGLPQYLETGAQAEMAVNPSLPRCRRAYFDVSASHKVGEFVPATVADATQLPLRLPLLGPTLPAGPDLRPRPQMCA
jgi:hypothetical protein